MYLRVAVCLGAWLALPGLRGDLGGFARELASLNCPNGLRVRLLYRFTCFAIWQISKMLLDISAILSNSKYFFAFQVKSKEHAGGMPRHARHKQSAGLKETPALNGFSGEQHTRHTKDLKVMCSGMLE